MPELQLSEGTIHYREEGTGPPIVFVHGLLVNGRVWERVVEAISGRARCIVPDFPLGSHPRPMRPDADLSPKGLARLVAEVIGRLELDGVTVVGNDTGGAISQLTAAHHPEHIGGLVLTNCDAFENFPPPVFRPLFGVLGRVPGAAASVGLLGRVGAIRRRAMGLAPLTVEPIPDELLASWIEPLRIRGVRRDLVHVSRGVSARYTLEAAERLRDFPRPALIAWGTRDRFFRVEDAERLAELLPDSRLERIKNARTFVQLDAPERLADLILELSSRAAATS